MNLLFDPLISVQRHDGSVDQYTLPGVMAALSTDQVRDFPGLRPHQRTAWHSLLVQVGALGCLHQGSAVPTGSGDEWRDWLLSLTPDWPNGEAWALVNANVQQPAFLQPPEPSGSLKDFKEICCADDLDVLVKSRNHDVKQSIMVDAPPEQWIFALVMLQTRQGYYGSGNYGISRMNGAYSNRPFFGVRPQGGVGRWFQRDLRELGRYRAELLREYPAYRASGGLGLLWLPAWDGTASLQPSDLDPWYVEICRRVRLEAQEDARLVARIAGSKAARIDTKGLFGCTGDPWTPLVLEGTRRKSLTPQQQHFGYRLLAPIIFPSGGSEARIHRSLSQIVSPLDDQDGLTVIASALVRGDGRTEGFYERSIPVSRNSRQGFIYAPTDAAAKSAQERVDEASLLSREVLYPAALTIFTGAPSKGERKRDDDTAKARARSVCDEFERAVDKDFFEALNEELDAIDDETARDAVRGTWLRSIGERARDTLHEAQSRAPDSAMRHYRIRSRAQSIFEQQWHRHFGARGLSLAEARPVPENLGRLES
jgi:CRISPR system Cascade subunit CasA